MNWSVDPAAMLGMAGVTTTDTSVAAVTVTVVKPLIDPEVAVMVAEPTFAAVATPLEPMLTELLADEFQVTLLVRFCVLPSLYVPVAVNCCVVPLAREGFAGVTAIDTRFAAVPVPLRATVCGALLALSAKLSVPLRVFNAVGANITEAVQLAPAARVLGLKGHVVVYVKSARLLLMLVMVRGFD